MSNAKYKYIITIIPVIVIIILSIGIITNSTVYQKDFKIYYQSAFSFSKGLNPYDSHEVQPDLISGSPLNYVYPPLTFYIFRLFTLFEYQTASILYLILKIIAVVFLLLLWKKHFLEIGNKSVFIIFCFLGFNGALCIDLFAGNISIFEQLLLWVGFWYFLKNKSILFGLCILVLASFKILPIIFILLFIFQNNDKKILYMFVFSILFAAEMLVSYLINPELFMSFLKNGANIVETGVINPCNLSLFRDIIKEIGEISGMPISDYIAQLAYILSSIIIVVIFLRAIKKIRLGKMHKDKLEILYLFCISYALILPRFKDYSYILLLVPAYYILLKYRNKIPFYIFLGIFLLSGNRYIPIPGIDLLYEAFWAYYQLILAYLIWGLYLFHIFVIQANDEKVLRNAAA
jgi:hypothetical protein